MVDESLTNEVMMELLFLVTEAYLLISLIITRDRNHALLVHMHLNVALLLTPFWSSSSVECTPTWILLHKTKSELLPLCR